jgi:hypothetical protein
MSKRSVPLPPAVDRHRAPEAIALRIHQIAATAGVIAEGEEEPLSHALYLIEESLLDVKERVEQLRQVSR